MATSWNPDLPAERFMIGMDQSSHADMSVIFWRMPDGEYVRVPEYLPPHWLNRITPEWGPDRHGALRWHYVWTGWNNGEGHAKVRENGKTVYCHRRVVEIVEQRKLSRWNHVDHQCERKGCLNYECLEAVSPGENTRRGPGAQHQFKPADAYQEQAVSSATYRELYMNQPVEPLDGLE